MGDWNELVGDRLDLKSLSQEEQEQTIAELAGHLDDLYSEYRERGLNESEATQRAIHEVTDWHGLAKNIRRAKEEESVNHRTKQLWLPGLINLTAAMLVLLFESTWTFTHES